VPEGPGNQGNGLAVLVGALVRERLPGANGREAEQTAVVTAGWWDCAEEGIAELTKQPEVNILWAYAGYNRACDALRAFERSRENESGEQF
jgi:hypothetical protein